MSSAAVVSNSVKNGILFVFVVLIAHVYLKNTLADQQSAGVRQTFVLPGGQGQARGGQGPPPRPPGSALRPRAAGPAVPPQAMAAAERLLAASDDAALFDYVFGAGAKPPPPAVASPAKAESPPLPPAAAKAMTPVTPVAPPLSQPPPLPTSATGLGSEGDSQNNGCQVVGVYANERDMCGGQLYADGPGIAGFDGSATHFSWQNV